MKIDQDKAQEAVDHYLATHSQPRALDLWQLLEAHAQPEPLAPTPDADLIDAGDGILIRLHPLPDQEIRP